jgi:hypothetical protein
MDSLGDCAPSLANAVAAAAKVTMLATRSTFLSMVMFRSATEHDLHDAVCALNLSSRTCLRFLLRGQHLLHTLRPRRVTARHLDDPPTKGAHVRVSLGGHVARLRVALARHVSLNLDQPLLLVEEKSGHLPGWSFG